MNSSGTIFILFHSNSTLLLWHNMNKITYVELHFVAQFLRSTLISDTIFGRPSTDGDLGWSLTSSSLISMVSFFGYEFDIASLTTSNCLISGLLLMGIIKTHVQINKYVMRPEYRRIDHENHGSAFKLCHITIARMNNHCMYNINIYVHVCIRILYLCIWCLFLRRLLQTMHILKSSNLPC